MPPDRFALSFWAVVHPVIPLLAGIAGDTPCWLVGGAIRDAMLGRHPKDADFVYVADGTSPTLPQRLAAFFDAPCIRFEKYLT
ncbi:MAG: hypothetical protein ABI743_12000, partial [bacterium]